MTRFDVARRSDDAAAADFADILRYARTLRSKPPLCRHEIAAQNVTGQGV